MTLPKRLRRLGDAFAVLSRKSGVTDEDVTILDQTRDRRPAEPPNLADATFHPPQDSPTTTNPR